MTKCECECGGGDGGDGDGGGGNNDFSGCLVIIVLVWLVAWGGCELPGDVKAVRELLEEQKAKQGGNADGTEPEATPR